MTTRHDLPISDHLNGLRVAMLAFADVADRLGPDTAVPTCPDWKLVNLIAHQGMVHRWATMNLRGGKLDPDAAEREGRRAADRGEWLRDGAIEFVTTLTSAADDVDALVFLRDAPPAKQFWARRQCHETTVHAIDAVSAELGRRPTTDDLPWLTSQIAADGIDELLTGFLPRSRSTMRLEAPLRLAVTPVDSELAWLVELGTEPAKVSRMAAAEVPASDVVVAGDLRASFLTLWNRSDEAAPDEWDFWRSGSTVTW